MNSQMNYNLQHLSSKQTERNITTDSNDNTKFCPSWKSAFPLKRKAKKTQHQINEKRELSVSQRRKYTYHKEEHDEAEQKPHQHPVHQILRCSILLIATLAYRDVRGKKKEQVNTSAVRSCCSWCSCRNKSARACAIRVSNMCTTHAHANVHMNTAL